MNRRLPFMARNGLARAFRRGPLLKVERTQRFRRLGSGF